MEKRERPKSLPSVTIRQTTGHGTMFVTVTFLNESPIEVFVHIGKSGSHERGWMEAMARAISAGLRYGVPLAEYVEQLRGISCGDAFSDGTRLVHSPADALAAVLDTFVDKQPEPEVK